MPTYCVPPDWFQGTESQPTSWEGQWQETHQVVQHPHEGLKLVLPQPVLLHGPEGAPCPLHGAHLMGSVLLFQEDEVVHSPSAGQGRDLQ